MSASLLNKCLETLVREWYTTTRPPLCCSVVLRWEDFKSKINGELAAAVDQKKEELESRDQTYCSDPACSTFIGAEQTSTIAATATCPACKREICTKCKASSPHLGDDCVADESEINVLEQAHEEGWQRCRECRMLVERQDGCPHMTCLCGFEFCYDCGEPYSGCICGKWEQHQLFEDAVRDAVETEARLQTPDTPTWDNVDAASEAQPDTQPPNDLLGADVANDAAINDGPVFGPATQAMRKKIHR